MPNKFDPSQLRINMGKIREHLATKGARKAILAGAKVVATAMVERAPEQEVRTMGSDSLEVGELKGSVRARTKMVDGRPVGLAGPTGRAARGGYLVEFGHRMVTGGKSRLGEDGQYHGDGKALEEDVPAYPWARPAWEGSHAEAVKAMGAVVNSEIKEAVKS